MQYTENYSLRKPQTAETASVSDLNYNSDRIDAILADDRQISVAMYVSGNTYNTGDLVGYENPSTHHIRVYRCLVDNVTGVWDSTKWTLTNLADEILDAKASGGTEVEANPTGTPSDTMHTVRIDDVIYDVSGDSANQNIADAFSTLQTYAVGDYCIYESILYKCTTAIETAGAWDSTKWTPCVVTDEMGSGGGGGSSTFAGLSDVSLTSLTDGDFPQYDATAQKWKNVAIAGVSVQPVIYSTEEREIGVWTDARPLYQKTVSVGGTVPTGAVLITRISNEGYDTIQYIKSADTPGSGTWTPSGVPAVHYSTDEQVVGTWYDGSTLYQKTITFNAVYSSSWVIYSHGIQNVDEIVSLKAAITSQGTYYELPQYRSANTAIIIGATSTEIQYINSWLSNSGMVIIATLQYTKSS